MKLHHHIVVTGMLSLGFTVQVQSTARTKLEPEVRMDPAASAIPGVHDFDFCIGRLQVHHRRLKEQSIWWLGITRNSCQREQAFSGDQGAAGETRWEMYFIREL